MIRRLILVASGFVLGASFVGIARGHDGFGRFLHSGHSDRMKGVLTARDFVRQKPQQSYVVVAPVEIVVLDEGCEVSREPDGLILEPVAPGSPCRVAAPGLVPDHALIKHLAWNFRTMSPMPGATVEAHLMSYDRVGDGERDLVAAGDSVRPIDDDCTEGCSAGFALPPAPGVNPVINQRRTYTALLETTTSLEITRVRVTYQTDRLVP